MKKLILFLLVIICFSCKVLAQSRIHIDQDSLMKVDLSKKVAKSSGVKYTIQKQIDNLAVVDSMFIEGVRSNILLKEEQSDSLYIVSFNKYNPFEVIFTPSQDYFNYIINEKSFSGFFVIDEVYFYVERDCPSGVLSRTSVKKEFELERTIYVGNANKIPLLLGPHYDPISWICIYKDKEFTVIDKCLL